MRQALRHIIPLLMLTPFGAVAQTNDYKVTSGMKPDAMPKPLRPEHHNPLPKPIFDKPLNAEQSSTASLSVDTAHQVILLIGDSMTDGLGHIFVDYAAENDYELHTVVWYGSRTDHWAKRGDLDYHIKRVHPTFIVLCLGTNDLGFYDFSRRQQWINDIINKVGDIPYVWIGPLPWAKIRNRDLVGIIRDCVGEKRFFDSSNIQIPRADGIHPTLAGAKVWMNKIAQWLSNPETTLHPLQMRTPTRMVRFVADEKHTPRYKGRPAME